MLYPFAILAVAALTTPPAAPAFVAVEASHLLHHVAGRPKAAIGNSKRERQDPAASASRETGAFLTAAQLEVLFKGNTAFGIVVDDAEGPFRHYFAPDGRLLGYEGTSTWSIADDTLCVKNEGSEDVCYKVRRLPDATYALESSGRVDAYFKAVEGNHFDF